MGRGGRVAIVCSVLALAAGLAVMTAMAFIATSPPTVDYSAGHQSGRPVNVVMQTVGTYGAGTHASWVSYLTQAPGGQWVHTTLWQVPAHTRINVTIYQYDSGSPLRNQQLGLVQGTIGGYMLVNGKKVRVINSYAGNGVAHTFSMPSVGLSVPLYGNNSNANLCSAAPCTTSSPHNVIQFSFMSPGAGEYPWQCFVPCGLGYLYGNGGPMQTVGYMDGFMKVVS
jgi:hypothetical protein